MFNRWAKDIKVIYAPVLKCQFYDRVESMRLEQARAIFHEYFGIIYYWIKGKI